MVSTLKPLNYTSADIVSETAREITLHIGSYRGFAMTQTYDKLPGWNNPPCPIYITDQDRSLTVYVQELYLP